VPTVDGWRLVEGPVVSATPEAALGDFLSAAEAGDFETAYRLLAGPWRARYTPGLLESDFRQEPAARERLVRAREALALGPAQVSDEVALFPLGAGREVRLVREAQGWRVAALE
jgi:hypothetical protein